MADIKRHKDANDHDIWCRCFLAALAGRGGQVGPHVQIAIDAAQIADFALEEEEKRRNEPQDQAF
jgi:hypothetical protein